MKDEMLVGAKDQKKAAKMENKKADHSVFVMDMAKVGMRAAGRGKPKVEKLDNSMADMKESMKVCLRERKKVVPKDKKKETQKEHQKAEQKVDD
jgi:Mg-chelatase subunit ChlI